VDGSSTSENTFDRIVSMFLVEMDGIFVQDEVIVVGATQHLASIDTAIRRPGRLGNKVYVGPPESLEERVEVVKACLANTPILDEEDPNEFFIWVARGLPPLVLSRAEVAQYCQQAVMRALVRDPVNVRGVNRGDFKP
jgi:SpoVK/Ycf46/Vps4 family AAA+-type ATPase